MSLRAWGGLLTEVGRQGELWQKRQQELEEKRLEEERYNRRMEAQYAKQRALAIEERGWKKEDAEAENNRKKGDQVVGVDPDTGMNVTKAEAEAGKKFVHSKVYEQNLPKTDMQRRAEEAEVGLKEAQRDQIKAKTLPSVEDIYEGIMKTGAYTEEEAQALAESKHSELTAGRGKSGGKPYEEHKTEDGKIIRTYPNGSTVQMRTDEEMRADAAAKAEAWAEKQGEGWFNSKPKDELISKKAEELYQQAKTSYDNSHQSGMAKPLGLLAPKTNKTDKTVSKTGDGVTDKIGLPNQGGQVDFDAALKAMRQVESNGKDFKNGDFVTSPKGAQGSSQVMPKTAGDPGYGVKPANLTGNKQNDARELNRVGEEYLSAMIEKYDGNLAMAYAAYNAGPGAIDKWIERGADPKSLPKETQDYIKRAMKQYGNYVSTEEKVPSAVTDKEVPVAEDKVGNAVSGLLKVSSKEEAQAILAGLTPQERAAAKAEIDSQRNGNANQQPPKPVENYGAGTSARPTGLLGDYGSNLMSEAGMESAPETMAILRSIKGSLSDVEYQKALSLMETESVDIGPIISRLGADGFRKYLKTVSGQ